MSKSECASGSKQGFEPERGHRSLIFCKCMCIEQLIFDSQPLYAMDIVHVKFNVTLVCHLLFMTMACACVLSLSLSLSLSLARARASQTWRDRHRHRDTEREFGGVSV